jgi:hypothetical protein
VRERECSILSQRVLGVGEREKERERERKREKWPNSKFLKGL